jgi:hypothetical protein
MPRAFASRGSRSDRLSRLCTWSTSGWMAASTSSRRASIAGEAQLSAKLPKAQLLTRAVTPTPSTAYQRSWPCGSSGA